MRILSRDARQNELKVLPETIEDLWYLSRVIEPGDSVVGSSTRRFRVEGLRAESGERKHVKVKLLVEKAEFAEAANKLRLTGKILAGEPEEFVSLGEHHTLDVEPHEAITIVKELGAYQEHMLKEAVERSKEASVGIIAMDDEKATFAMLSHRGAEFSAEVRCHAEKRFPEKYDQQMREFLGEVASIAKGVQTGTIIVAGPGFVKENFKKFLENKHPDIAEKIVLEDASSAERSAVYEILRKGALKRALLKLKIQEEFLALEELKVNLAREELAVYGFEKTSQAIAANAVSEILVLDEEIRRREVSDLIEEARKKGARIVIFDSRDSAGEEFKTYRVAALLRFKLW
jgi:protein pelota